MQQKNEIRRYWSTNIGEFYNPDHGQIKKKLLAFFEDYIEQLKEEGQIT